MAQRSIGLTGIFNLIHDASTLGQSDIDELRKLQQTLDREVLAAYGWSDIEADFGFHEFRKETRWTFAPNVTQEILDRLLEENNRRAAEQSPVARGKLRAKAELIGSYASAITQERFF